MVDWKNKKCRIENLVLEPIMNQVLEVISISHVYQEFNIIVDQLSKEALLLQDGYFSEQEFGGGTQVSTFDKALF